MELSGELFTSTLSLSGFLITIIAFFASLYFFQQATKLQKEANDALIIITERSSQIQGLIQGAFNKTLAAALNKRELLVDDLEAISDEILNAKTTIISEAEQQLKTLANKEGARLIESVESQLTSIQEKIKGIQSATETLTINQPIQASTLETKILHALINSSRPLTSTEISNFLSRTRDLKSSDSEDLGRTLRNMQSKGIISRKFDNSGNALFSA